MAAQGLARDLELLRGERHSPVGSGERSLSEVHHERHHANVSAFTGQGSHADCLVLSPNMIDSSCRFVHVAR